MSPTSYQMCHQLVTSHSATLNKGTTISLLYVRLRRSRAAVTTWPPASTNSAAMVYRASVSGDGPASTQSNLK